MYLGTPVCNWTIQLSTTKWEKLSIHVSCRLSYAQSASIYAPMHTPASKNCVCKNIKHVILAILPGWNLYMYSWWLIIDRPQRGTLERDADGAVLESSSFKFASGDFSLQEILVYTSSITYPGSNEIRSYLQRREMGLFNVFHAVS